VPVNSDHPSAGAFPLGTTTVTCTATDNHYNKASGRAAHPMSAGVFASSIGALVGGSHGAGTMQNATSGRATVNVNASTA
jgi:hypothetical protein